MWPMYETKVGCCDECGVESKEPSCFVCGRALKERTPDPIVNPHRNQPGELTDSGESPDFGHLYRWLMHVSFGPADAANECPSGG